MIIPHVIMLNNINVKQLTVISAMHWLKNGNKRGYVLDDAYNYNYTYKAKWI